MDKELVRNCFDKSAITYDSVAEVQKQSSRDLVNMINIKNLSSVIDIGCGTGNTSLELYRKYPNADYTLCDISRKMLDIAVSKFPFAVNTICCDAENYEFPKYDLAISNLSIQWFASPNKFIQKARNHFKTFAFSVLVDTAFKKYKSNFDFFPKFEYPSIKELEREVGKNYRINDYNLEFENFFDLTKYFIKLGAYARSNLKPVFKNYCGKKITLDYKIFIGILDNS